MNIEIVDYGICQAIGNTTKDIVQESSTGYFLHSDDMAFIERTDVIYPKTGLSFGISYRFETDTEVADLVEFECRIKHPQMINPANNEAFTEIVEAKDEWSDELGFDFYTLEFDWEIKFGEWIFEVIHEGKVLASQSFYLKEWGES
ncbi:DUF3859 domain-containing protein [Ancylomarina sp. DW003]|nr:DUF3859 domain-containing protein [Ancylomarina sp. DW003]MDE5423680.1 DUF3859 domain-containing protein [Ancylomarina sp. DW003]